MKRSDVLIRREEKDNGPHVETICDYWQLSIDPESNYMTLEVKKYLNVADREEAPTQIEHIRQNSRTDMPVTNDLTLHYDYDHDNDTWVIYVGSSIELYYSCEGEMKMDHAVILRKVKEMQSARK